MTNHDQGLDLEPQDGLSPSSERHIASRARPRAMRALANAPARAHAFACRDAVAHRRRAPRRAGMNRPVSNPSTSMVLVATHARRGRRASPVAAFDGDGDTGGSLLDALDDACPVPKDQRPSSQLRELEESAVLGWPALGAGAYATRMCVMFVFFYGVIAYPIACGSYNADTEFVACVVSASVGAFGATAAMALNMYNGWSYVRDRLLSATVEYEETGWYDGQVYVKDPEMLARDRLLGTYTVRPIVEMLRKTLLGCGATALVSLVGLRFIDAPAGLETNAGAYGGSYSATMAAKYEDIDDDDDDAEEDMEAMQMRAYGAPSMNVHDAE